MMLFGGRQQAAFLCVVVESEAERKNIFWVVDLELISSTY